MKRSETTTREPICSYHSVEFDAVGKAVAFCQQLVPYVVPPVGCIEGAHESRAVVWFHVPCDASATAGCCKLYLSHAALLAARRAGLEVPFVETIARTALPCGAALVFGEDHHDQADGDHQTGAALRRTGAGRMAAHQVDVLEADTVLR